MEVGRRVLEDYHPLERPKEGNPANDRGQHFATLAASTNMMGEWAQRFSFKTRFRRFPTSKAAVLQGGPRSLFKLFKGPIQQWVLLPTNVGTAFGIPASGKQNPC